MFTIFLFTATAAFQKPVVFNDQRLGVSFTLPAKWTVDKNRSHKSKGDIAVYALKLPDGSASLEVMRASFHGTRSEWEHIQTDINKSLNRKVVRQWQQDVSGIPLLLTEIKAESGLATQEVLTGLFLSQAKQNLLFRLTCPSSDYDQVEYDFTQSLQTIAIAKGAEIAKKKGEGQDTTGAATAAAPIDNPTVLFAEPGAPAPFTKKDSTSFTVPGISATFEVPRAWKTEKSKAGAVVLRDSVTGVTVAISSVPGLTIDGWQGWLASAADNDLASFDSVLYRHDVLIDSGALTLQGGYVWRDGKIKGMPVGKLLGILVDANEAVRFDATVAKPSIHDPRRRRLSALMKTIVVK